MCDLVSDLMLCLVFILGCSCKPEAIVSNDIDIYTLVLSNLLLI